MKTITAFRCPVCTGLLTSVLGTKIDPEDGVNLECPNVGCGMADWAHGKNEKEAFEIFKQKCGVTGREK
jgi:hypothetical protein